MAPKKAVKKTGAKGTNEAAVKEQREAREGQLKDQLAEIQKQKIEFRAEAPHNVEQRQKIRESLDATVKASRATRSRLTRLVRVSNLKRALKYEREYRAAEHKLVADRRIARAHGNFFREPDSKLLFVVRIKGILKVQPKQRKILQLLRLRQLHNGVFLQNNKATKQMLVQVAPLVTYGYPSLARVKQLLLRRGFGKSKSLSKTESGSRIKLSDNDFVQSCLGEHGIESVEDLVHEIYTVGPKFKQANGFLWPFKLRAPRGGFTNKRHGFCEQRGGDWGNREDLINKLIDRML